MKTVFLSYSHQNLKDADIIDGVLGHYEDVNVIRDVKHLKARDNIQDFMEGIRKADFAALIISQAFLQSDSCMKELLDLFKDKNAKDKAIPIVIDSQLYGEENKTEIYRFWDSRKDDLKEKISNFLPNNTPPRHLQQDLEKAEKIRTDLGDVFDYIANHKGLIITELEASNFIELLEILGLPPLHSTFLTSSISILEGFKNPVRIYRGRITYENFSHDAPYPLPSLPEGMNFAITEGRIFLDETNHISVYVETLSPWEEWQKINQQYGLEAFTLKGPVFEKTISFDSTVEFEAIRNVSVSQGQDGFSLQSLQREPIPTDINIESRYVSSATFLKEKIVGKGKSEMIISFPQMPLPPVTVLGNFNFETYIA